MIKKVLCCLNGVSLTALDGDLNITAKTIQDIAIIEENLTQRKRSNYTYEGRINMESLPSLSVAHYASPNDLYLSLEEEEGKDFSYKDIEEKVTSSNAVSSTFVVGRDINLHSYGDISLEGTQIVSTPNQNLNNVLLHSEMGSISLKAAESTSSSNFKETYAASSNLRFEVAKGASEDDENNKVLLFSSAYIDSFEEGSVFEDRISWIDEETKSIDKELLEETLTDSKKELLLERKTNLAKEKDNYLLKKDKDVATHIKDPEEYYSYENSQNTISYNPLNLIANNDITIIAKQDILLESSNLKTQSGDLNLETTLGDIKIESLENSNEKSADLLVYGKAITWVESTENRLANKMKESLPELISQIDEVVARNTQARATNPTAKGEYLSTSFATQNIQALTSSLESKTGDVSLSSSAGILQLKVAKISKVKPGTVCKI